MEKWESISIQFMLGSIDPGRLHGYVFIPKGHLPCQLLRRYRPGCAFQYSQHDGGDVADPSRCHSGSPGLTPPTFGERLRSNPPELFWNGWLPDPGNDPDFIRSIFQTDAEYNYGHFSNADFDSLVDRAAMSHDPAIRQALYIEAERLLCETEAGIIPLYHTFSNIP